MANSQERDLGGDAAMALAIRQNHSLFAAEVTGIDLRVASDPTTLAEIRALLDRYAVLVFREQPFEDEEQIAFAQRLDGELVTKVGRSVIDHARRLKHDALTDISNLDENEAIIDRTDRRRMYALGNRIWHTDASFQHPSARYSMLSARAVPAAGGETEYADMRAAYDALPEPLKAQIAVLRAFHSIIYSRETIGFTDFSERERAEFPGAEQPLIRVHPGSGRTTLYLASHASHIVGWPIPEGRLLLRDLMTLATLPEFVYTHRWRSGDFVIWDNRATMHRGLPFDDATQRRDLRRVTTLDLDSVQAPHD
jgi:alpha-ketoglutarate-dependent 2,4-dichlorophenoxyacetate dioxygenase